MGGVGTVAFAGLLMRSLTVTRKLASAIILALAMLALCLPASAQAQTYRDVAKSYWAYSAIDWVTNQGPANAKLLNDYPGGVFNPSQAITQQQLVTALVAALGYQRNSVAHPIALADLPATSSCFQAVQAALALHLLATSKGNFYPNAGVTESQADHALASIFHDGSRDLFWGPVPALSPDSVCA
jgi:hypothetical protein